MEAIIIYSMGICSMSICVKKDLKKAFIEKEINKMSPSGVPTKWQISKDKTFRSGQTNPCQCKENDNRLHYLLNC